MVIAKPPGISGADLDRKISVTDFVCRALWISNTLFVWTDQHSPGMGVTKPISSVPLFSEIFNIVKKHIMYWISRLYLAGVAAAQLRWHLLNMNVIQRT